VKWPSAYKVGYTKAVPSGVLINRLFKEWARGELLPEVQDAMYAQPPKIDRICEIISSGQCPEFDSCMRPHDHYLLNEIGIDFTQRETWFLFDRYLRRTILILMILGKEGMRPGGYHRHDLKKIAGTKSNSTTDRIIKRLKELHFVERRKPRGKSPRYSYVRPDFLQKLAKKGTKSRLSAKEWKLFEQFENEYYRRYARDLINRLRRLMPKVATTKPGKAFVNGVHYATLPSAILIGHQPPKWYVDILSKYLYLMQESMFPLYRPEAEEEFYDIFERVAHSLAEKLKNVPKDEAAWWLEDYRKLKSALEDVEEEEEDVEEEDDFLIVLDLGSDRL